jgi:hypothetical protein
MPPHFFLLYIQVQNYQVAFSVVSVYALLSSRELSHLLIAIMFSTIRRNGNLEPIGILFTDLAGQPVPPPMLVELLGIVRKFIPK